MITAWLVVAYLGGVTVSILLPYFLAWLETNEPFEWRMNIGRLITAIIGLLPTLAAADFIAQLGALGYFGAFVFGLGVSQFGRLGQKAGAAVLEHGKEKG